MRLYCATAAQTHPETHIPIDHEEMLDLKQSRYRSRRFIEKEGGSLRCEGPDHERNGMGAVSGAVKMMIGSRLAAMVAAVLVSGLLLACGSGGDGASSTSYALLIYQPGSLTTTNDYISLSGEGFLPAGSKCSGTCEGLLPPPVFGELGTYALTWSNAANGQSGRILLRWQCNCGGSAPFWMTDVPLASGANLITIVETDANGSQQATITITRS